MKKLVQKGFTLIELLIVIGILGILVAAVLLAINPAEGQKKARDTKRMKDLTTLQIIIDQAVADGIFTATGAWNSGTGTSACNGGWLGGAGINLCKYVPVLPVDPSSKASTTIAGAAGATDCTSATTVSAKATYYYVNYDQPSGSYEINVRQESTSNCGNLENDGGNSNLNAEAGTDDALNLLTDN